MSANSAVTYTSVHSKARSWKYVPDPIELEDHVPVYIPEPEHPEDLVPAEDEAPIEAYITEVASAPLPPPSFLPSLMRPLRTRAAMVESINGKKYILVVVDDYSRYTWTHFLRSKAETPEKTLQTYFQEEGISHQTKISQTAKQNDVVERQNRTVVEADRTIVSAAKLPLFFLAEAISTACYTQNRALVIPRHEKTPYNIINEWKHSLKFLHIFGCTCYIVRDGENLDKMKEMGDPCIFVGYPTHSKGYRVYNKRTRMIVKTIHVNFDEQKELESDENTLDPAPQRQMASDHDNSGPAPKLYKASDHNCLEPEIQDHNNEPSSSTLGPKVVPALDTTISSSLQELELLCSPMFDEYFNGGNQVAGDGVTSIKRRRDLSSNGVRNLVTTSGRGRLKEDLESSTWRRHSLDLDGENKERPRLRLFQFSLRDQASNWLERLPAGSITTWEDLTTRFLAQFFPPGRTTKLRNDVLMFQQHHGESLFEA
ncbi:retrovirus-related pol polyprotein from transposon TNT 1-94 [Tanacetum coccineum]